MNNSPVIGIPCRHDTSGRYTGRPINAQNTAYTRAIIWAGGIPVLIPLELDEAALRTVYKLCGGILLTGGGDVNPHLYRQSPHPSIQDVQAERDRVEITLARWAAADCKPLLGICRGIQVMAVAVGGTLVQDIPSQVGAAVRHDNFYDNDGYARDYLAHPVHLNSESRLAQLLQTETLPVNSLHHQAIQALPEPYQIVGRAADGVPEALDLPEHPFFCGV
ncbi:MAG: gamma-glutamyl-gamma-aminobutyrate hydrolase family protein, partial [Anaerolineae bacterium]